MLEDCSEVSGGRSKKKRGGFGRRGWSKKHGQYDGEEKGKLGLGTKIKAFGGKAGKRLGVALQVCGTSRGLA